MGLGVVFGELVSSNRFYSFPGQRFALLEEKIVLSYILRNFSIDSTQTVDELHTCSELITRPKEGIYVTIAKR